MQLNASPESVKAAQRQRKSAEKMQKMSQANKGNSMQHKPARAAQYVAQVS
jgi:hypothetical protein